MHNQIRERNFSQFREILLLSGSLLGASAHAAGESSRSRLCRLRLSPVLLTDHFITAHYSSFRLEQEDKTTVLCSTTGGLVIREDRRILTTMAAFVCVVVDLLAIPTVQPAGH